MNREKLKHCILYFLEHINNVHLGRTKLMKLLYYVDFDHYERWERSVTGAVYRKLPHGPVPAEAQKIINDMVRRGELSGCRVKRGQYEQHRLVTASVQFDRWSTSRKRGNMQLLPTSKRRATTKRRGWRRQFAN